MGRKRLLKEHELIEAIKGSRGFISTIASRLHCDWHTVDDAIKLSEKAQQAIKDEEETTLDVVEGKALSKINDGDGAMIRFYLATKGKKRGYTYEPQLDGDDDAGENAPLNIICDGEEVDPAPIEADE